MIKRPLETSRKKQKHRDGIPQKSVFLGCSGKITYELLIDRSYAHMSIDWQS